jgi:hypothetical protein
VIGWDEKCDDTIAARMLISFSSMTQNAYGFVVDSDSLIAGAVVES